MHTFRLVDAKGETALVKFHWKPLARTGAECLHDGRQHRPLTHELSGDRARGVRDEGEVEGEVLELSPLTSANGEESSGGETRTLNLAVNSRLLCH